MLRLVIDNGEAPPVPAPGDPGVTTWREHDGTVAGCGYSDGERHWIHMPHVGTFFFGAVHGEVRAFPNPGARREWVEDAFRRSITPLALQSTGREALHASAVCTRAGVLALCAVSETGKSTIAYALGQQGYPLWADDAVVWETGPSGVRVWPLPFQVRLRPASAHFFDAPACRLESPAGQDHRLAAICVLGRKDGSSGGAAVDMVRLAAAEAFPQVLAHAYCFTLLDTAAKRRMLEQYLALVDSVPVFSVRFPEGLDHLPEIVRALEQVIEPPQESA